MQPQLQAQAAMLARQTMATPATVQPAVASTISTATATTAALNSGVDTADIATLNDALGSAGVDLRVSFIFNTIFLPYKPPLIGSRQRKKPSSERMNISNRIVPMKTVHASSQ